MVYTTTSMDEVIGRIVRNTGLQDTRLLAGFVEWIPEAMGIMKTKYTLVKKWEDMEIEFHKTKLPCGLRSVLGVAYNGQRLRYYKGIRSANETCEVPGPRPLGDTVFTSQIKSLVSPEGNQVLITDIQKLNDCQQSCHTYYTEMGWLNTSLADGEVRVFYNSIPLDENDLPLIPDNENYKQAIYWYVRGAMIGAGHADPVFKYDYCDAKFWLHASKALGEIRYPSVDMVETSKEMVSLIKDEGYFESFFGNRQKQY